ncbi:hypothetical protein EAS56_17625 [Bradyrhizobium guangzhouense]|uniref:Uncharacterized protein n=1 Tax=Bradyrhizobium guangzhouense TaxID=1325095 RepID=A0ABY0E4V2_9BRAD|nr:hypothetical protein [Bradyrhizobium guangzhouense]RXH12328.1 hypothetical protein EAS56_17625 [Bradyrhizobium guangzhouense]
MTTLAILLCSCASSSKYWDDFVSSGETMKLFTFVDCANKPDEWPAHQTYYHAGYFSEGWGGSYYAQWVNANKKEESAQLFVSWRWDVGLRNYDKLRFAEPPKWMKNPRCAAVIQSPWSSDKKQPFASAGTPEQLAFEATVAARCAGVIGFIVAVAFLVSWAYASAGYVGAPIDRNPLATLFLLFAFVVSALAWFSCASVSDKIERLRAYYEFFDNLPKDIWGHLLPLSWWQVQRLVGGPPLPTETTVSFGPFYATVAVAALSWALLFGRDILIGMHCAHHDPFKTLRTSAKRQGRPPTPEEITAVLAQTSLGASTLHIEAASRRARVLTWEQ